MDTATLRRSQQRLTRRVAADDHARPSASQYSHQPTRRTATLQYPPLPTCWPLRAAPTCHHRTLDHAVTCTAAETTSCWRRWNTHVVALPSTDPTHLTPFPLSCRCLDHTRAAQLSTPPSLSSHHELDSSPRRAAVLASAHRRPTCWCLSPHSTPRPVPPPAMTPHPARAAAAPSPPLALSRSASHLSCTVTDAFAPPSSHWCTGPSTPPSSRSASSCSWTASLAAGRGSATAGRRQARQVVARQEARRRLLLLPLRPPPPPQRRPPIPHAQSSQRCGSCRRAAAAGAGEGVRRCVSDAAGGWWAAAGAAGAVRGGAA